MLLSVVDLAFSVKTFINIELHSQGCAQAVAMREEVQEKQTARWARACRVPRHLNLVLAARDAGGMRFDSPSRWQGMCERCGLQPCLSQVRVHGQNTPSLRTWVPS